MLFPFRTDAPIYYWPIVTVGLIIVNTLIFAMGLQYSEPLLLQFGHGLHPSQWLTNIFLHGDAWHLIGNMVWLWAFGLIVEGKLGWWKYLLVYLGIGMAQSAVSQIIMLPAAEGAALGASGAIFGLVAISLIWAPKNDMYCLLVLFFVPRVIEIPVMFLAGGYLLFELAIAGITKFAMSSALLHILGAFFGFGIGVFLLFTKRVDCEGWDLFSVLQGKHNRIHHEIGSWRKGPQEPAPEETAEEEPQGISHDAAKAQISEILASGKPQLALVAHKRLLQMEPEWLLPPEMHLKLISCLLREGEYEQAVETMQHYLQLHRQNAGKVRLKLAEVLVMQLERPSAALKVLAKVSPIELSPEQEEIAKRLRAKATALQGEGVIEMESEDF